MIPILYDKTEKEFRTLGIGPLSDAISCEVTEERNGSYELRMTYPITGVHYSDITNEAIICAIPADGKDAQPFRIYKISRPINGKISVYAEHLSYQLSHIVVMPFTAHGAGNTLSGLIDNSIGDQPFSVWTDIANGTTEYNQTVPASFRSRLGGVSGSVLDCFGGEYEFDQWNVKLHAHRGTDRGVSIEYGKNLLSVTQEENIANVVTGIVPMWKSNDGDTVVTLPEVLIESEYADRYTYKRNIVYDFSSEFQDQPTEEELRAKAESYISSNLIGVPEVSIDVDFVALSDTEEYKDLERERINLCDTVTVRFAELGIDTTAKVVKTVYDVLGERYTKVSIGSVKASIVDTVNSIQQTQKEESDTFKSFVASTLAKQKDIMTGGLGGHVVVNYVNGYPSEIVIGDTDNIKTMKHCIVINKNGIGFSDGYNADVSSAWTIDGTFSADYILTGTLNAERIKAGIIQDLLGRNYWNLDTGEFSLSGYATDDELSNGISDANTYSDQQAQGALDTAKSYADTSAKNAINAQTQDDIFNKLTNNGAVKGIILTDGKLYINADYITSGILNANLLRAGIIKSAKNENNYWDLDTGEFRLQAIDNMLVGGTNLVDGTMKDVYVSAGGNTEEHMVLYTSLEQDKPYVLSFEATSSNTNQITVRALIPNSGIYKDYTVEINNGRSYVFINAEDQATDLYLYCGLYGQTAWKTVKFHHIMLEKGTVASDWSPSPNDLMSTVAELSQEDIFNKLTNNGQTQGLYLQNGKIYLNLEYLVSNIIKGLSIFGSTITFGDQNDTYRVQASYKESSTSYEGYVPRGVTFETFDSGASVQHITDKFLVTSYTNRSHNMLFLQEGTFSQLRSKKPDGSSEAWVSASTVHDDPGVLLSVEKGNDILNTLYVGTDEIYLAVDYLKNILSFKSGGKLALNGKYNSEQYSITSIDGNGNIVYKTQRNNFLQACDGSDNVKAYLQMYSNGQAWLSSDGQMVVQGYGNTFIKSIGNGVYLQAKNSDDNGDVAKLYLQNDGKVFLNGSLNKYTYINGYPAVRVNGSYHDIFFQWNGASLIATVDVTQVWSTSDRRLKDQIDTISDDYIDAIGSAEIKQFIFTDEIYDKSIKHFGVIAQDVREALESKGINPEEIAVNNHFDRDGEEYYGIDKDEFFMARIAYDEKIIKELKNEISDLREQINQIKEMLKS